MFKPTLILILMLISASSFAAAVTVNGQSCGSLKSLEMSGAGDWTVETDGTCGNPPVTPPVTPPSACPAGVSCTAMAWPNAAQKTLTQRMGDVLAIKVKTTADGVMGKVATAYTSGNAGNRVVALSAKPGDFAVTKECIVTGTQSTNLSWIQGSAASTYRCRLPANGEAWVNIKHAYCEGVCEFYLTTY